ncbi:VOC family protein [Streptomyces sp. SBC-4]|nr:VOC family protein [Streptomyces sp. SBC-4]MDV5143151.1 VOC family protein [Streptomyces sp. SBC-4]
MPRPPDRLPPGRTWSPRRTPPPAGRIKSLDHIAVCLPGGTLDQHARFYQDGFGLGRFYSEYVSVGDQAMDSVVVRSTHGGVTFTLVAPDPDKHTGQLDSFLERNGGPGVQHLAFLVDDIIPAVRECKQRGVDFLTPPTPTTTSSPNASPTCGPSSASCATPTYSPTATSGGTCSALHPLPHERNTLFYELIQRQGSRGFGSSNIRACTKRWNASG